MASDEFVLFLKAQIGDFKTKLKEAGHEVETLEAKGEGFGKKFSAVGGALLTGLGAAVIAVGAFGLKMADDYEKAHARLETAVKNTGANFDDFKGKIADVDSKMEHFGFTNADTEGNLSTLVNATHSTSRAITDMSLAADIARGRNIDLGTAVSILAKVETGHVALLGRLGISTKDATGATIDQHEAIKRLTAMYGGQAAAYTETFAGKMARLKAEGIDWAKNIGMALIPIIEKLGNTVAGIVNWFEKHRVAALALAAVIGTVLVAAITTFIAMKVVEFVQAAITAFQAAAAVVEAFAAKTVAAREALMGLTGAQAASAAGGGALAGAAVAGAEALSLVADAIPPLGALIMQNIDDAKVHGEAMKAAAKALADFGKEAEKSSDPLEVLSRHLKEYQDDLKAIRTELKQNNEDPSADQQGTIDYFKKIIAELKKMIQAQKDEIAQSGVTRDAMVKDAEATARLHGKALKDFEKSVGAAQAVFGEFATGVLVQDGLSAESLRGLVAEAQKMDSGITHSFNSAMDPIKAFTHQAKISGQEFMDELRKENEGAHRWADELKLAAQAGVDMGLLRSIAEAGPQAEPQLKAIIDEVSQHGVGAINMTKTDTDRVLQGIIDTMNARVASDADAAARWARSVHDAAQGVLGRQFEFGPVVAPSNLPGGASAHLHAAGGVFDQPHLGVVGEAGPEAVIPLSQPSRAAQIMREAGLAGGNSGAVHIDAQFHVHGNVYGIDDLAHMLDQRDAELVRSLRAGRK